MSNNVNLINVFSLVVGPALPVRFQQREEPQTEVQLANNENNEVEEKEEDVEVIAVKTPNLQCKLLRRVLMVGALALVLGLWCRKQREEVAE